MKLLKLQLRTPLMYHIIKKKGIFVLAFFEIIVALYLYIHKYIYIYIYKI